MKITITNDQGEVLDTIGFKDSDFSDVRLAAYPYKIKDLAEEVKALVFDEASTLARRANRKTR